MRISLLFLLLAFSFSALAQQKFTISGYVQEKGSKETLPGVAIYLPKYKTGTTSNSYGFYSLTLNADTVELIVQYVGYVQQKHKVVLDRNVELNIEVSPMQLEEIVVEADQAEKISQETQMSTISVPVEQIKDIPALLGEKDVLKVIQLLPGVQKGSEGSSGIYVRGGGPDQNLVILDDATVYNVSHLFGFFSLFNGDALKSVELIKGGFPARYGGRLSSVLEMRMKEGGKDSLRGEAGIGLIASRLLLEGPIIKNKASFLVSARRTYIDLLMRPFLKQDNLFGYYFYDLNAKANYVLNDKNKFYLSGYFGNDKAYNKGKISTDWTFDAFLRWGNATGTARWNHQWNPKVFTNASLIFANYSMAIGYAETYDNETFSMRYSSGIRDFSLKYDLDFAPSPEHFIKAGLQSTYHRFTPSAIVVKSSYVPDNINKSRGIDTYESGLYIEDDWTVTSKLKGNFGVRLSHFHNEGKDYLRPEPRVALRYLLKDDLAIKGSYAMMNQYLHLLSNTGLGLPTDLWVPTTKNISPQRCWQAAGGLAKDWFEKKLMISVEGYYKRSFDILGYKEGASFLLLDDPESGEEVNWENNVTPGQAWSYGAEFMVQRKFGKLTGWVGYTLSWTQLQFDSLNFGEKFFARYDRRHDASVVLIYKLKENITLSGTWVYGTGNAITLPLSEYSASEHDPTLGTTSSQFGPGQQGSGFDYFVSEYGEKNSFRMAAYHRMDVGIQFHKKKKRVERTFELSFYNVYNRKNPFYYYVGYDRYTNVRKLKQVSLFPVIPSVSWNYKF